MANTIREYTSDGSRTLYPIDFSLGYLRKEFVYVYLKTGDQTVQLQYTWPNNNEIELSAPVALGQTLVIRRIVDRDTLINDYEDGAILHESNLDASFMQSLMILQEIQDGYMDPDGNGDWIISTNLDMNFYDILNLPEATDGHSPPTLNQMNAEIAVLNQTITNAINEIKGASGGATLLELPEQITSTAVLQYDAPVVGSLDPTLYFVWYGGLRLRPTVDFTVPEAGKIEFTSAPADNIELNVLGVKPNVVVVDGNFLQPVIRESVVLAAPVSGVQTAQFTLSVTNAAVYLRSLQADSKLLFEGHDYTVIGNNTIQLAPETYPAGTTLFLGVPTVPKQEDKITHVDFLANSSLVTFPVDTNTVTIGGAGTPRTGCGFDATNEQDGRVVRVSASKTGESIELLKNATMEETVLLGGDVGSYSGVTLLAESGVWRVVGLGVLR